MSLSPFPDAAAPPRHHVRVVRSCAAFIAFALILTAFIAANSPGRAHAAGLLTLNKPTTASSVESPAYAASNATDASLSTRWSSAFGDNQWLQVDLGMKRVLGGATIVWEAAYARTFTISGSDDGVVWQDLTRVTYGTPGTQNVPLYSDVRYLRLNGLTRATNYGFSVRDFDVQPWGPPPCQGDAARDHPAQASSVENASSPASAAFDGNPATRWSSAFSDSQWISVDLGRVLSLCGVTLTWERAYARVFHLEGSRDGVAWVRLTGDLNGNEGTQQIRFGGASNIGGSARYVRLVGEARATAWGYSLFEIRVSPNLVQDPVCGSPFPCPSTPAPIGDPLITPPPSAP